MAICQCMILAFTMGWENDCYGKRDLEIGREYALDLIKFQHLKTEPHHHYNLRDFIKWCDDKLKGINA